MITVKEPVGVVALFTRVIEELDLPPGVFNLVPGTASKSLVFDDVAAPFCGYKTSRSGSRKRPGRP